MGLIGIILASVVNIFLHSSPLAMLVSIIGVGLFTLLAAYDTQRIKITYQQYMAYAGPEEVAKLSVYDALTMYLNFVNLFQFLIQFMGFAQITRTEITICAILEILKGAAVDAALSAFWTKKS